LPNDPGAVNENGGRLPTSRLFSITALWGAVWLLGVVAGLLLLLHYESAPGPVLAPVAHWPTDSSTTQGSNEFSLIMLAHPRCPCTRASIDELAHLMVHCQGKARAHVLFFKPGDAPTDWEQTDLWRSAAAIPGVQVAVDIDGKEAKRLGAATSGHVLLFGPNGQCHYSGGITGSRGHPGDNLGRSAVLSRLRGESSDVTELPVFGCLLYQLPAGDRN
jgi:hypothetical protein